MKKIEFDVLAMISEKVDLAEIAVKLYKDDTTIDMAVHSLEDAGYLDHNIVTDKGWKMLEEHRIDNAVILAAGMSTRFVPLNYEFPKGLLSVKGEVLIERQIRQLREKGIQEIIIVVGYMKEKFEYLVDKYDVILVETTEYRTRNNHASIYAAGGYLKNTIITSSDLYFAENIFQTYAFDSYYCTIFEAGKTAERGITTDEDDKIIETMYGDRCYDIWVTLGYAFFSKRFSAKMLEIIEKIYDLPQTANMFWADIQDEYLEDLYMYAKRCDSDIIYEFDSLEELRQFDPKYRDNSGSSILHKISYMLGVSESDIKKMHTMSDHKSSMFKFTCLEDEYICDSEPDETNKVMYHGGMYYQCRDYDDKNLKLFRKDRNFIIRKMKKNNTAHELQALYSNSKSFIDYHRRALPLCAAENVISEFVNLPLSYGFQERYIMNNTYSFNMEDNFIGCEKLLPFYQMLTGACERIFGAKYTDPRPFTGMHCIDMLVKTICRSGDKIMLLGKEYGGHASVKPVVERLGLQVYEAPYNLEENDLDYVALNNMIEQEKIPYILLAPSDIIRPLSVESIDTANCTLLYDCSQLMGLIAAGLISNPLDSMKNIVMFGGTHKTFPGPASGLILTNDDELHERMEREINPKYTRHSQMHQKVSLLFALIEFEKYGSAYMSHMVHCSNYLGQKLEEKGYNISRIHNQISHTHQIFMKTSMEEMERIYHNAYKYEVTLNKKEKRLFDGYGIRLGTQEIARYDWNDEALDQVAEILYALSDNNIDTRMVQEMIHTLPDKKIAYTFAKEDIENFAHLGEEYA